MKSTNFWSFSPVLLLTFFLFHSCFVTANTNSVERPLNISHFRISSSPNAMKNDGLREWFLSVLEIRNQKENDEILNRETRNKGRQGPVNAPQYVQNLYDRMALENIAKQFSTRKRRNANSYETTSTVGSMTIQAIARDGQVINEHTDQGYLLQFSLDHLWVSNKELQLAELVLAVDYGRLIAPPASYSVFAYTIDNDIDSRIRSRLLVKATSLSVLDTFGNNFVKLDVTDAVTRKIRADGRRSITFEIFVACKYRNESEAGEQAVEISGDLNHREIANLLHLSSHGFHQPLLVFYSSATEQIGDEMNQRARRRRSMSTSSTISAGQNAATNGGCTLHEWWVDLADLFREVVIKPEGFYANYCSGTCRYPMYDEKRWNATGNANLRSAYNTYIRQRSKRNASAANESSDVPDAKCVAHSTSPITVLYKVGENFIIRQLSSMVATSCGCA